MFRVCEKFKMCVQTTQVENQEDEDLGDTLRIF